MGIVMSWLVAQALGASQMESREWMTLLHDLTVKGQVTRYPQVDYVSFSIARGDAPDSDVDRHVEYLNLAGKSGDNGSFRATDLTEVAETWTRLAPEVWQVDQTITTVELSGRVRSILRHTLTLDHRILASEKNVLETTDPDAAQLDAWQASLARWGELLRERPPRPGRWNAKQTAI